MPLFYHNYRPIAAFYKIATIGPYPIMAFSKHYYRPFFFKCGFNTSTLNPTLPITDKTHEKHAPPHPIITRTSPPLHIPIHHSTTPQFPKPTSPQHHTTKNTSVSSLQNRAHTNTHPLATWKRIPRNASHEAMTKTELLGQKRAAPHHDHQSELPSKKFMVSQIDNETPLLLAEAGSQPCQEP